MARSLNIVGLLIILHIVRMSVVLDLYLIRKTNKIYNVIITVLNDNLQ